MLITVAHSSPWRKEAMGAASGRDTGGHQDLAEKFCWEPAPLGQRWETSDQGPFLSAAQVKMGRQVWEMGKPLPDQPKQGLQEHRAPGLCERQTSLPFSSHHLVLSATLCP